MVYTEVKVEDKTYLKLHPSDAMPLRLYQAFRAQKLEIIYKIRTILLTIGTVSYRRSKYLVDII